MAVVAGKTESRTARFRAGPRNGTRQGQGAEVRGPSAGRKETTCGLRQRGPSSKPFAASAITRPVSWLGPETSGVHPHKGSRCSAGGHRHGIPSAQGGLFTLARRRRQGSPRGRARHPIKGMAAGAIRGAMTFSPVARWRADGRAPVAEGDARFGVPRGAGRLPRRQ